MLKVNWDVTTTNRGCTRIGIGVIIRDSCGNVLASLQQHLSYCVNSLSAALTKGLFMTASFCTQLGLTFVQFEGVSSRVVNTIIEKESCPWQIEELKADFYSLVASISWSLHCCHRLMNKAAHSLATTALFLDHEHIDINCVASCIQPIVMAECQLI